MDIIAYAIAANNAVLLHPIMNIAFHNTTEKTCYLLRLKELKLGIIFLAFIKNQRPEVHTET